MAIKYVDEYDYDVMVMIMIMDYVSSCNRFANLRVLLSSFRQQYLHISLSLYIYIDMCVFNLAHSVNSTFVLP